MDMLRRTIMKYVQDYFLWPSSGPRILHRLPLFLLGTRYVLQLSHHILLSVQKQFSLHMPQFQNKNWQVMHKNPFSGKSSTEPFGKDYCHFYAYAFCGKMASLGNTVNSIELTPSLKRCVPASLRGRVSTLRMLLPTHFPKNPSSPKG